MPKVPINGLGRIGRAALKALMDAGGLDLVAVNDIVEAENLSYLLQYDTVYGALPPRGQVFTTAEDLEKHVRAGARYVILSAPTQSETIPTVVHGVNRADGSRQIISCAAGQRLVGGPSSSFRRGPAGATNLVSTSIGAARATTRAMPELAGRFDGIAVRAPIPVGSVADVVFVASQPARTEEVNEMFRQEAATPRYEGILGVSDGS